MRLITLETSTGSEHIINTDHISSIELDANSVLVVMSNGRVVRTKFTDVYHAADYVQRAASHSFTGTI